MEAREFLASRRAKITPEMAGLTLFGGRRRVPGLRREEVAMLAGVSTTDCNVGDVVGEVIVTAEVSALPVAPSVAMTRKVPGVCPAV